jgi:hypothetical protein
MELTAAGTAHDFNVIPLQFFQLKKFTLYQLQKYSFILNFKK